LPLGITVEGNSVGNALGENVGKEDGLKVEITDGISVVNEVGEVDGAVVGGPGHAVLQGQNC